MAKSVEQFWSSIVTTNGFAPHLTNILDIEDEEVRAFSLLTRVTFLCTLGHKHERDEAIAKYECLLESLRRFIKINERKFCSICINLTELLETHLKDPSIVFNGYDESSSNTLDRGQENKENYPIKQILSPNKKNEKILAPETQVLSECSFNVKKSIKDNITSIPETMVPDHYGDTDFFEENLNESRNTHKRSTQNVTENTTVETLNSKNKSLSPIIGKMLTPHRNVRRSLNENFSNCSIETPKSGGSSVSQNKNNQSCGSHNNDRDYSQLNNCSPNSVEYLSQGLLESPSLLVPGKCSTPIISTEKRSLHVDLLTKNSTLKGIDAKTVCLLSTSKSSCESANAKTVSHSSTSKSSGESANAKTVGYFTNLKTSGQSSNAKPSNETISVDKISNEEKEGSFSSSISEVIRTPNVKADSYNQYMSNNLKRKSPNHNLLKKQECSVKPTTSSTDRQLDITSRQNQDSNKYSISSKLNKHTSEFISCKKDKVSKLSRSKSLLSKASKISFEMSSPSKAKKNYRQTKITPETFLKKTHISKLTGLLKNTEKRFENDQELNKAIEQSLKSKEMEDLIREKNRQIKDISLNNSIKDNLDDSIDSLNKDQLNTSISNINKKNQGSSNTSISDVNKNQVTLDTSVTNVNKNQVHSDISSNDVNKKHKVYLDTSISNGSKANQSLLFEKSALDLLNEDEILAHLDKSSEDVNRSTEDKTRSTEDETRSTEDETRSIKDETRSTKDVANLSSDVLDRKQKQLEINKEKKIVGRLKSPDINSSFDVLPAKPNEPGFAYKGSPIRKKQKKKTVDGWDCHECRDYYHAKGLSDEDKKLVLNKCSRHRSKYKQVTNTPQGFWNPDWDSCLEENVDTPVSRKKKHKRDSSIMSSVDTPVTKRKKLQIEGGNVQGGFDTHNKRIEISKHNEKKISDNDETSSVKKKKISDNDETFSVKKKKISDNDETFSVKKKKISDHDETSSVKKKKISDNDQTFSVNEKKISDNDETSSVNKKKKSNREQNKEIFSNNKKNISSCNKEISSYSKKNEISSHDQNKEISSHDKEKFEDKTHIKAAPSKIQNTSFIDTGKTKSKKDKGKKKSLVGFNDAQSSNNRKKKKSRWYDKYMDFEISIPDGFRH